jgi:hypothetical protein
MRRWTILIVAVLALALVGSAQAKKAKPVKEKVDATFTLTSGPGACSLLPSGTVIEGSGKGESKTTTEVRQGITMVSNTTHIRGEATDQAGHRYTFDYLNEFTVWNSTADPGTFKGVMTDFFTLEPKGKQSGGVSLDNGFIANFTTDFDTFAQYDPLSTFGDPIDFSAGTAHCDPL